MRIRTELSDCDEIIIRCRERNDRIRTIENVIEEALRSENEITLYIGNTEYYVPKSKILFFESDGGKVYAHTVDNMYTVHYKLLELEEIMPCHFVRISKSAIANINLISYLRRELVGNGEMGFIGCDKKVYFSRAYYKLLKYKIDETRFRK